MAGAWWTVALAILGAVATAAGALKGVGEFYERYLRRNFVVERNLTSSSAVGNTIWIINLGDKPVLISRWDIVWARRWLRARVPTHLCGESDSEDDGIAIAPHARVRLNFADESHFETNAKTAERFGRLYFRVWLSGRRRPRWFHLL